MRGKIALFALKEENFRAHTANCFLIAFRYKNNINRLFLSEFSGIFPPLQLPLTYFVSSLPCFLTNDSIVTFSMPASDFSPFFHSHRSFMHKRKFLLPLSHPTRESEKKLWLLLRCPFGARNLWNGTKMSLSRGCEKKSFGFDIFMVKS